MGLNMADVAGCQPYSGTQGEEQSGKKDSGKRLHGQYGLGATMPKSDDDSSVVMTQLHIDNSASDSSLWHKISTT